MGMYYMFANFTDEEMIDFSSGKMLEIKSNALDKNILVYYLSWFSGIGDEKEMRFVGDEDGSWEKAIKFKDRTCDVFIDMFEDDFIPSLSDICFIYQKFKEADRFEELGEWIKKFKKVKR
jgi:hypothetical protein